MNKKESESKHLVRKVKSIVVDPKENSYIDQSVVKKRYCHALNYPNLPEEFKNVQLTVGVTSPNRGEGKTLTAANLAVSFALAYRKKTVLIDMNMVNPSLHKVFGTKLHPGLMESFQNGSIFLSKTKVDQLYLLPAGRPDNNGNGLESIMPLHDILYSLEQEFEIIIMDLNSVLPIDDFPVVCLNELDGLMVVIDTNKTKFTDVERMFKYINKDQLLGFVFNNMDER